LTTSSPPRGQVPQHVAWLVAWLVASLVIDYFAYAARPGASARRAARLGFHRRLLRTPQLPHWLYFSHVVRRDYLSRCNTGSTSSTPHAAATLSFGRIALTIHLD
jgi:hypothetical protein